MKYSDDWNRKLFFIFIRIGVLVSFITLVIHAAASGIDFLDHEWIWKECACTLKGIDAAEAMRTGMAVEGVGALPPASSTLPWTKVMGVLVHGAFLNYMMSCFYYSALNILTFVIVLWLVYRKLYDHYSDKVIAELGVFGMLTSWYITDWILKGNNATLVCLFVIGAICLLDTHENWSGILLAFAMIKPQIAGPFFLVLMLKKKWRLVIISGGITLLCWGASVWITGIGPIRQLSNILYLRVNLNESYLVYGIFDGLQSFGVSSTVVLGASMLFGIGITLILVSMLERKGVTQGVFTIYVIPAIVSVFWCYKSQCDYNILMIVAIALVEYWYASERSSKDLIFVISGFIIVMMKPIALTNGIGGILGLWNRGEMYYLTNRIDLYLKSLFLVWFVITNRTIIYSTKQKQ